MHIRYLFLALIAICAGFVVQLGSASANTPRQVPGSYLFGPEVIFTDGSTSDVFMPLSQPMPSAGLVNIRIYLEVTEATGGTNLRTRPALRYSGDGVGWDPAVAINTNYIQGSATQPGSTFVDISALGTPKPWIQFGVQVHNFNANPYEIAHAVLLVEPKGR